MLKASQTRGDSCDLNVLNDEVDKKVIGGDVLCKKVNAFTGGKEVQNVKIGFFYSACGGDWKPVKSKNITLESTEEICCHYRNGKLRYRKCQGDPLAFRERCL